MSEAPTSDGTALAATSRRRYHRVLRGASSLVFVGGPVLAMAALAVLWVRSYWVAERWTAQYATIDDYDPVLRINRTLRCDAVAESERGSVSLRVDWRLDEEIVADRPRERWLLDARQARFTMLRQGLGSDWEWSYETLDPDKPDEPTGEESTAQSIRDADLLPIAGVRPGVGGFLLPPPFGDDPPELQARLRFDPPRRPESSPFIDQFWHPLAYCAWTGPASENDRNHLTVVAPYWVGLGPLLLPVVWWLWCPAGRCWPRLTLRRSLAAVAAVGGFLGVLSRPPATDYARLALERFADNRVYEVDPAGSREPALVGISLDVGMCELTRPLTATEAKRVRGALAGLIHLRRLQVDHTPQGIPVGPIFQDLGPLLPASLPALEVLEVSRVRIDAASLAQVAQLPKLRRLTLTRTGVTDADLEHLRDLTALTDLELCQSHLTDAALVPLRGHPRLRRVSLRLEWNDAAGPIKPDEQPAFSDAALQRLADSLPSLEELVCPDGTVLRPSRPGAGLGRPALQP